MRRERVDALRQARVAIGLRAGPAQRRVGIDRRVEVVAERSAQRGLEPFFHREQVEHRRPHALGIHMQHLCECTRLGLQPVHAPLRVGERLACNIEGLPGGRMGRLRTHGCGLRRFDVALRLGPKPVPANRHRRTRRLQTRKLGVHIGKLARRAIWQSA